jgi:DNA-binding CsgD family transcriptional regulator
MAEASEFLENEEQVAEVVGRALLDTCPRGLAYVLTVRDQTGNSVGVMRGFMGGSEVSLEACKRAYAEAPVGYDRSYVKAEQRERWIEPVGTMVSTDVYKQSPIYRALRPYEVMEHGRHLVCLGPRLMGVVGVLLPEGDPGFTPQERRHLGDRARAVSAPLRLSALAGVAQPAMEALDHLMAQRGDRAFVLSGAGLLMDASPAGRRAINENPALRGALGEVIKAAGPATRTVVLTDLGFQLHVSPCSPRGGAAAFLVVAAESGPATGRGRLSPRQSELIEHVSEGLTNKQIAERMQLAPSSVKTMLERLYRRLGVSGRAALVRWARSDA